VVKVEVLQEPTLEVITIDEVKDQLKIEDSEEDSLLLQYLAAATAHAEDYAGIYIRTRPIKFWFDDFPSVDLKLYASPITAITKVEYYDVANVLTEYTLGDVDFDKFTGKIRPVFGKSWPSVYERYNAVGVEATSGFTQATLPVPIKQAILMLTGHYFEHREATTIRSSETSKELEFAFKALLDPYRKNVI